LQTRLGGEPPAAKMVMWWRHLAYNVPKWQHFCKFFVGDFNDFGKFLTF
jgi:hypothetical protein